MDKITKYLFLNALFTIFFIHSSFSQTNTLNLKQVDSTVTQDSLKVGEHFFYEGFKLPATRGEEIAIRKARRYTLTTKEYIILSRYNKGKPLKFWQRLQVPFIKRKKKKYDKIISKKSNSTISGSAPNKKRYTLSIKEQELINNTDTSNLTKQQKRLRQKALKKQARIAKYKEKHQQTKLTEEQQTIINKGNKDKKLLTKEERKTYRKLKPIDRKNKRIKKQRQQMKIDSALAAGAWLPVEPKKHPLKTLWHNLKNPKQRPSSYVKKLKRIEKRYKLTPEEQQAWNMYKSHVGISKKTKKLAYRAYYKLHTKYEKEKKVKHKEFMKLQPRQTRKNLKKKNRQTNKKVKKFFNH